jgi:hypothetical protein
MMTPSAKAQAEAQAGYEQWKARRAECLRAGHTWRGDICTRCGMARYGHAKAKKQETA